MRFSDLYNFPHKREKNKNTPNNRLALWQILIKLTHCALLSHFFLRSNSYKTCSRQQIASEVSQFCPQPLHSAAFCPIWNHIQYLLGFPTGRDFLVPQQRDRRVCPGIFPAALVPGQRDSGTRKLFLSRDKGTTGRPFPDCPGTSRPLEILVSMSCGVWNVWSWELSWKYNK